MNYGDLVPLPKLVSCIMYYVCICMSVWYPCMYFFIIIVYHLRFHLIFYM